MNGVLGVFLCEKDGVLRGYLCVGDGVLRVICR
jgi:hypothetical protein